MSSQSESLDLNELFCNHLANSGLSGLGKMAKIRQAEQLLESGWEVDDLAKPPPLSCDTSVRWAPTGPRHGSQIP
jgi:hypothetical protein